MFGWGCGGGLICVGSLIGVVDLEAQRLPLLAAEGAMLVVLVIQTSHEHHLVQLMLQLLLRVLDVLISNAIINKYTKLP